MSAFDLPLGESKCVSCGACVNVCPTGALVSVTPTVKNPPLPFEDEDFICTFCDKNCKFTKRSINGTIVKMVPEKISEVCSLGVFGLPAINNMNAYETDEEKQKIKECIFGSMKNYQGEIDKNITFDELSNKLC